ncbi:PTS glucose transporter subunit IIBC [Clostridium perfringens]|nr:PTS glucose transporter subunit IIBC [Clostridium perfringens]
MMKYFQRLGKSLMLPVAALPVAGILMGIGYWIDSSIGANNVIAGAIATFLLKSGGAIIDNMAILFAIGVSVGMSDDNDGAAGLAGLVSWLMITTLLSTSVVAMLQGVDVEAVNPAFGKIQNQFIGIVAGLIGASCYNRFKNTKLPDFLGFFSGRRCVAIVTALVSIVAALVLYFVYPVIYNALVSFGKSIISIGPIGAGLYGFFNRLLIPLGLHHALNSVFWFDVAGINDIANFWSETSGTLGQTGMYMSGFFPIMMFGLPAGAFAMYRCAKDNKKKAAAGILLAAALSSFFTGVTEPLEFAFMFLAPALYFAHAVLTGISMAVVAALPVRAGFNFSAGLVDWLLSFASPMALNPIYLIAIGLVVAVIYYLVFVVMIKKFDLKTPGREDDDEDDSNAVLANNDYTNVAKIILEGLGSASNITSIDNCVTRLRLEVKDNTLVNEKKIKSSGVAGVIRPGKTSVQVIVGTQVQFVADEFKKLCKSKNYV